MRQEPETQENLNINRSNDLFDYSINDLSEDEDFLRNKTENLNENDDDEVDALANCIEKELHLLHNKNSNFVNLHETENYIRKNFNLDEFLKSNPNLYESTKHLTGASMEDLFFSNENENVLYILVIVREKVVKAFEEFLKPCEIDESATFSNESSNKQVNPDEALCLFKDFFKESSSHLIPYIKELPGFEDFTQNDLIMLSNRHWYMLFLFKFAKLFKENEFYLILNEIQITHDLLNKMFGNVIMDSIFEFENIFKNINLTIYETALLIPYFLTIDGKFLSLLYIQF